MVLAQIGRYAYISVPSLTAMRAMAEIFICYRRTDSEGYAGRLHDRLQEHFGARAVFVDVDNLHPGVDFEEVIQKTLLRSTVVLVVIGPRWLDQRLRNEADYVRREIVAALKGKKRLIPVLVGDAKMPSREKLPPELSSLAGKNGVTLRHAMWKADVQRLLTSLDRILARKTTAPKTNSPSVSAPPKSKATRAPRSRGKAAEPLPAAHKETKARTTKSKPAATQSPVAKASPRPKKKAAQTKSTPPPPAKKKGVTPRGVAKKPVRGSVGPLAKGADRTPTPAKTTPAGATKAGGRKPAAGTGKQPTKR